MLAVKVEGLSEFDRKVRKLAEMPDAIARSINFAVADTLDEVAGKRAGQGLMAAAVDRVFDSPGVTPYIKRNLKKRYPTGRAKPGFMEPAGPSKAGIYYEFFGNNGLSPEDVMKPHVFGGGRKVKPFERRLRGIGGLGLSYGMPGKDAKLTKYGNMSGAQISQMLSYLGTVETAQSYQRGGKERKQTKGMRKAKKPVSFYIVKTGSGRLIIRRIGDKTERFMFMTEKTPQYRKRVKYDFFEIGSGHMLREFNRLWPEKLFRELKAIE